MKIKTKSVIDVHDWDDLVEKTYGRVYVLQQQDGCKSRGTEKLTIPSEPNDYKNDTIPEVINGEKMGVSFAGWLARDPKAPLSTEPDGRQDGIDLWWERNFYPDIQMVANDLHARGLIESGDYIIEIDW